MAAPSASADPFAHAIGGMHVGYARKMRDHTRPEQFADVYTQSEWTSLVARCEVRYAAKTHCLCFNASNDLTPVVEEENLRLRPFGLAWSLTQPQQLLKLASFTNMCMVLSWKNGPRQKWEEANPKRRAVSQEQQPAEFWSYETRTRIESERKEENLGAVVPAPAPVQQEMEMTASSS